MAVDSRRTFHLAVNGARPVRTTLLPYARQTIDDEDIRSVVAVLRSDWITTGPKVAEFEEAFANYVGAKHAVAFSSGTAALHAAAFAADLAPGDESITTPMTFCATANCALYMGAKPRFVDVSDDTLNIDIDSVSNSVSSQTTVIMPVDYAGHPADLDPLLKLAEKHKLLVVEDACHALGAEYKGRRIGSISHMTAFSLHPAKHITSGEGGMITTDDEELTRKLRMFRNHGITTDAQQRSLAGQWHYEMIALGYNYRLSDIACALGLSQLRKLDENLARRREIANRYNKAFQQVPAVLPPIVRQHVNSAWHLYTIRLVPDRLRVARGEFFRALRAENIGVNVHYIPVHLHPYYRERLGHKEGEFPVAEKAYERLISLPIFYGMSDQDVDDVIEAVSKVAHCYEV